MPDTRYRLWGDTVAFLVFIALPFFSAHAEKIAGTRFAKNAAAEKRLDPCGVFLAKVDEAKSHARVERSARHDAAISPDMDVGRAVRGQR